MMNFFWHLLFTVTNWFPTVLSYNLLFGKGKILHFGPIGVVLVSAYGTFLTLRATESFFLGFLVGLLAALLVSALFAWLSLRLEPDGLGIMSIAVHLMILAIVLNWTSLTRGALGIPGIQRMAIIDSLPAIACVSAVIGVLWIFLMRWIDGSAFGRQIVALAEHEWHASALGIERFRVHMLAFLLYGVGATIVVFFYIQYIGLLHPNDYLFPTLILYVMCVVGGNPGSVRGVTIATTLILLLKEGLRFVPLAPGILGPVRLILFGIILFATVWWRRETIFQIGRAHV